MKFHSAVFHFRKLLASQTMHLSFNATARSPIASLSASSLSHSNFTSIAFSSVTVPDFNNQNNSLGSSSTTRTQLNSNLLAVTQFLDALPINAISVDGEDEDGM
jgi:hypothetical protein